MREMTEAPVEESVDCEIDADNSSKFCDRVLNVVAMMPLTVPESNIDCVVAGD